MRFGAVIGATTVAAFSIAPAFAATNDTGGADSSASTGTGSLFQLLDTDSCTAAAPSGTGTGRCGDGLSLNNQISAFSQNASGATDGNSSADASVAPIDITDIGTSLDLTGILDGIAAINTGTVVDSVINGLEDGLLKTLLQTLKLQDKLIAPIDDALQDALGAVADALPLGIEIGAVESQCSATAEPLSASGGSHVAGLDIVVHLGDEVIRVPMELGTQPNSNLLVTAPQDLVDGLFKGITATLTDSLDASLLPLDALLSGAIQPIIDKLLDALEPSLLQGLADALKDIVSGTVNKQDPVSPSSTGEISVTALELNLLGNTLDLGRTHCGPNSRGATPPGNPGNPGTPGNNPHVPTVVDAGMAGHTDHTARNVLGATAALMLLAGTAGLLGYRRMLTK
jgi:hypothetical protein